MSAVMARPSTEQLEPCNACGKMPRVSREKEGRVVFHLSPCCKEAYDWLFRRRPRFFAFGPGNPPSKYLEPFKQKSEAVHFWNQLMRTTPPEKGE